MITGIDARPVAVGSHLDTRAYGIDARLTAKRLAFTIKLIVAPGIITLARDCHNKESRVARMVSCSRAYSAFFLLLSWNDGW